MVFFKAHFKNLLIYQRNESWQQIKNVSTISPKLQQLGQKNTGTRRVNTTKVLSPQPNVCFNS